MGIPRLDPLYLVIFVDAIVVKVRDGRVRNTSFCVVMGVTTNGERGIPGIWVGDGAEGVRFWLLVFSELGNRGVEDVLIAVCDGLKGWPEAINTTWEHMVVQQCIVGLIGTRWVVLVGGIGMRSCVRSSPFAWPRPSRRPRTGSRISPPSGVIVVWWSCSLGVTSWAEFVSFLEYDVEIRRVICTTKPNRVDQRWLSQGCPGTWTLPERAGSAQVPLPCDEVV